MKLKFEKITGLFLASLFTFTIISCNNGHHEISNPDLNIQSDTLTYEQNLEIEIISKLLHKLIISNSQPPEEFYEEVSFLDKINNLDTINSFDTSHRNKFIYFYDTLYGINNLKSKSEYFDISTFFNEDLILDSIPSLKVDLSKLEIVFFEIADSLPPKDDCFISDYGYEGIIEISRLVFNENNTKAFFFFNFTCGCGCGRGTLYFIENVHGKWIIKEMKNTWIE